MRAMVVAGVLLAGCATAVSDAPTTSWGKAGVPMMTFLADAAYCAQAASTVRAEHQVLIQSRQTGGGSATPGSAEAAQASNDAMLAAANDQRAAQTHADARARQLAHNQCLRDRGYTEFRLTAEQRAHIDSLPPDSAERRDYLHQLSADANVLRTQAD